MTVWIYVNTNVAVGDVDHLVVFANPDLADEWFKENDSEAVAFEYEVREYRGRLPHSRAGNWSRWIGCQAREDGRRDLTLLRLYDPVRVEIALRIIPGVV